MELDKDWVRIQAPIKAVDVLDEPGFRACFDAGKPVILKGAVLDSPAHAKWSSDYIADAIGDRELPVYVSRDGTFAGGLGPFDDAQKKNVTMSVREFLERLSGAGKHEPILGEGERCYAYQTPDHIYEPILADLNDPPFLEAFREKGLRRRVWISGPGNLTPPHTDGWLDNILVQIRGKKTVLLWDPAQVAALSIQPFGEIHSRQSPVDVQTPAPAKFPDFSKARALYGLLEAGDWLFIPQAWIHCIYSESFSISVNYWFNAQEELERSLVGLAGVLKTLPDALRTCYLHLLRWPETVLKE